VAAGERVGPWILIGALGGFVTALVTVFKKNWAFATAPIYALLEGLFIGGLAAMLEQQFPGIAMQAAGLTFGTLFCLLLAYRSGMVRVTENFKLGVVAATGGIMLVYLASMILGLFGHTIPYIWSGMGPSASWSLSSGCISRSFDYSLSCGAGDSALHQPFGRTE
jgi:uncharacterized YccA/Bax inhibitor family protein